jgi:hypothetical protein
MIRILKVLALALLPTTALAGASYDEDTSTLRLTGATNMALVVSASNYITDNEVKYIEMWGPGGDMIMGIQLGQRISRIEGVTVVIPKGKGCTSACALSAMGAHHIRIDGKLMLHRPYIGGVRIIDVLEDAMAYMGQGYLRLAYYLEDQGYDRSVMNSMMEYTNPCTYMVYEGIEVKEREDLKIWALDNSRCEMMNSRIRR